MQNEKKKDIKRPEAMKMKSIVKILFVGLLMLVAAIAINAGDMLFQDGGLNVSQDLRVSTNVLYVNSASGLVGIGTTGPANKLSIKSTASGSASNYALRWENDFQANGILGYLGADVSAYNSGALYLYKNFEDSTVISASGNSYLMGGNVGIGTTAPNQKLMVSGNANVTGTIYYGALQANSPVLERTSEPFVAKCTIADDGKLVVEYIHEETGVYSRAIEAVNPDNDLWWHKSCYEKNEKFKFLDSLNNNSITIEDIGFDWDSRTAFVK